MSESPAKLGRIFLATWIFGLACGSYPPPGEGTETGDTTSASTGGSSTAAPTTTTGESTGHGDPGSSEVSGEPDDAPCCAPLEAPNSSVQGMTVRGPVTTPWAWYGRGSDTCEARYLIFLYADPPPSEIGNANVGTYLLLLLEEEEWPDGFQGTGPAYVQIVMATDTASTGAELTITRLDVPEPGTCEPGAPLASTARFEFTLSVQQVHWDVEGEVSAVYCPECDVTCP